MNTTALIICLSAAISALPTVSVARGNVSNSSQITALGESQQHTSGWLTTAGPDADGRYQMWINIADLDPATAAGWSAMTSRVARGTRVLCDISGEQPQIKGYYNGGERRCLRDANDAAQGQMTSAREAAREGKPVAVLGFSALR